MRAVDAVSTTPILACACNRTSWVGRVWVWQSPSKRWALPWPAIACEGSFASHFDSSKPPCRPWISWSRLATEHEMQHRASCVLASPPFGTG